MNHCSTTTARAWDPEPPDDEDEDNGPYCGTTTVHAIGGLR